MMVSERTHYKDVKSEKIFQIRLSTQKIQRFERSIFCHFVTKNSTKMAENSNFKKISNFYTVKNFPVNCFKTKEDE